MDYGTAGSVLFATCKSGIINMQHEEKASTDSGRLTLAPSPKADTAWSMVLERYKQNTTISTRKKNTIAFT